MKKEIHLCTELEWPDLAESLRVAIHENPGNVLRSPIERNSIPELRNLQAPFIAVLFKKMWAPGRELKIAFLGNVNSEVKNKIIKYANQWLSYVNLKFDFVAGSAGDLRISTEEGGSWSYLGTDARLISSDEATMNYGWLYPETPDQEYSRVVLHEFGHALGAIHEHQRPEAGIPWDRPKVYEYYAAQGWSKEDVDRNVLDKYNADQLNSSAYDRTSIMHYAVPEELTVGDWHVGWNTVLSPTDMAHMRKLYP